MKARRALSRCLSLDSASWLSLKHLSPQGISSAFSSLKQMRAVITATRFSPVAATLLGFFTSQRRRH